MDILAGIPTKITTPPKKCCLINPKRRNEHKGCQPTSYSPPRQIASFRSIAWPRYLSWLGFTMGALSGLRRKLFGGAQAGEGEKGRFPFRFGVRSQGRLGSLFCWAILFVPWLLCFPFLFVNISILVLNRFGNLMRFRKKNPLQFFSAFPRDFLISDLAVGPWAKNDKGRFSLDIWTKSPCGPGLKLATCHLQLLRMYFQHGSMRCHESSHEATAGWKISWSRFR